MSKLIEEKRKITLKTLHSKAKELKLTDTEIAKRAGIHRPNCPRMLSGNGSIKLDTLFKLGDAIGADFFTAIVNEITKINGKQSS